MTGVALRLSPSGIEPDFYRKSELLYGKTSTGSD